MKIVVEFYRIRAADNAHALVGRETAAAVDLDHAIDVARRLSQTLNMPQHPDVMTIIDVDGRKLYSGSLDP